MSPNNTAANALPEKEILPCIKQKLEDNNNYETIWGQFQTPLKWPNIILIFMVHLVALVSVLTFPYIYHLKTVAWEYVVGVLAGFGVTGGAHRLWTHKSYKAKLPLRIILLVAYATAGHNKLFHWVRDHRIHHKYSETNADPHNANRGLFFAHVGWLMMKKHPEVIEKGKKVDCSDIFEDSAVVFFERFFWQMQLVFCFALPVIVPCYFWNETFYYSFVATITRYVIVLNITWSVNSFAHLHGNKPYDKYIQPAENVLVSIFAMGEGWHNYHHTFPWDYKTSEFGSLKYNVTTSLLDLFGKIGWAYDFKTASKDLIENKVKSTGDGTHISEEHACKFS